MRISWTSKGIIVALAVAAAFFGQQRVRNYRLQKAIETEKQKLQTQLNDLEGKNRELNTTLGYLNSKAYKELVARQQLNLQKEGELVYSFTESPKNKETQGPLESKTSNFQKWAAYFLNKPQAHGRD